MRLIDPQAVQRMLDSLKDQPLYLHLEMTTGAYASLKDSSRFTASTFLSNGEIRFTHGSIAGSGPYRVGLKTETGWVYSEGLTHWEDGDTERLIMAGHDTEGKLVVGLQLSKDKF
ncbi:YojF family protein [Paenibacillus sp. MBLB4367]|uniref:YojF family protein n=1 Tax=Paenibacillus sp. MBLB4367 TaxID=3384767 RepID=UPI003907F15F